jgi:integrase
VAEIDLVPLLTEVMAGKDADALVFTTWRGKPLRNLNFRRDVFDKAADDPGVPDLVPHELRHTAASLAVSAGANVKAVQKMLGHSSAAMTLDVTPVSSMTTSIVSETESTRCVKFHHPLDESVPVPP